MTPIPLVISCCNYCRIEEKYIGNNNTNKNYYDNFKFQLLTWLQTILAVFYWIWVNGNNLNQKYAFRELRK